MVKKAVFHLPLLLILLLAAALRLFHYEILPYTHDELSALSRLDYNSFTELIDNGVRPDGHPALIQVFLFYWTKIGGTSEEWVKLPFILAGLASIFLVYKIAEKWFSKSTAVFSALFLACSQFFIIYSQYARPYISGTFFSLSALYFFLNIFLDEKQKKRDWIFFTLSLLLCALNHHVSALFAFLLGASGLFFLSGKTWKPYAISCTASVILYLPHLGITLGQLKIGGLNEWLSPPDSSFIFNFLFFLFHYSVLTGAVIFAIMVLSFWLGSSSQNNPSRNKIRILLLSLFLFSFLIPFFYSVYQKPILQYSSLVFSAPCLFLFLFSFLRELKRTFLIIFSFVMVFVMIFSLQYNRKFFDLNYKQGWEQMVLTANHFQKTFPDKRILAVVKSENFFVDFYKKKFRVNCPFIYEPNEKGLSSADIKNILDTSTADFILTANLQPQQVSELANVYPVVLAKNAGYNFEITVLSKSGNSAGSLFGENLFHSQTNFVNIPQEFKIDQSKLLKDSISNEMKFMVQPENEYPLNFLCNYKNIAGTTGNNILAEIELEIAPADTLEGLLCITVKNEKETIFFTASELEGYKLRGKNVVHACASMFVGNPEQFNKEDLNIFLWNNKKRKFAVKKFSVSVINSNPLKYSLLEKIQ